VAPELHKACEDHLNTIFEVDADSRVYADQLICLAWPWASDFVFCNERDGMHWVDGRFDFDNSWFDNHIIDNIYSRYELEKIVPLLREPAAGAK
jgi:catalase (peroxidase I)